MEKINIKKNLPKFLLLALAIGAIGSLAIYQVYAAVTPEVGVTNAGPTFSDGPSDAGSIITNPTNVGSNVTFTATAADSNNDSYYLVICKGDTTGVSSSGGAAPTCTGGSAAYWCRTDVAVAHDVQASCNYAVGAGDTSESYAWRAYVCDNNGASSCSSVNTGTGDNGTPFFVNHPPVISAVTAGASYGSDASVDPGNTIYFQATVTDTDTSDTIDMFVCSTGTTAFDASTGTCTNGTTLCSDLANASATNAQCSDAALVPVPTAHSSGTLNVKIYLRDNSVVKLANAVTSKTYSVTDVAPTQGTITFTDTTPNVGSNPLIPVSNSSVNQAFKATLTDNNGYADITSVVGAIYAPSNSLDGSGQCSSVSELTCYNAAAACTLSGGSGATVNVNCGQAANLITTWYNIAPSASWKARLTATTDLGATSFSSNEGTFTVNSLNSIGIDEATIAYGTLAVGDTSSAKTTTIKNYGNVIADAQIDGTDMSSGGNTIGRTQQHWNSASSWTWGSGDTALRASPPSSPAPSDGCSNLALAVTSAHATATSISRYWMIQIPGTQATGTYSGTINFTPAVDATCTGSM